MLSKGVLQPEVNTLQSSLHPAPRMTPLMTVPPLGSDTMAPENLLSIHKCIYNCHQGLHGQILLRSQVLSSIILSSSVEFLAVFSEYQTHFYFRVLIIRDPSRQKLHSIFFVQVRFLMKCLHHLNRNQLLFPL